MLCQLKRIRDGAVNTFETWLNSGNRRSNDTFAPDLLKVPPTDTKGQTELCCALSLFVIEARSVPEKVIQARTGHVTERPACVRTCN